MNKDDFEVIVVNDDPDEDIKSICEKDIFKNNLNIRIIQNSKNLGLPGSLNKILQNSMGRYFVRVDSDDYVSRDYLSYLSIFLDKNREYQAVSCNYDVVNHVGNLIERNVSNDGMSQIACGVMFTYESLCDIGFYNDSFKMREGHDLMSRYKEKFKCFNIPIPLYRYRMHETNRTKDVKKLEEYEDMLREGEK